MDKVAYNIKKIRELKNLKQEYLASELNISVRGYSKIENNETQLTLNRLKEISNILEVDPLDIIKFDTKKITTYSLNRDLEYKYDLDHLFQSIEKINEQNKKILEYINKKNLIY